MAVKGKAGKGGLKAVRAMPGKRASARGGAKAGARAARRNAYIEALIHNQQVHDRLQSGVGSIRAVYGRVLHRREGPHAVVYDRKSWRELRRAIVSFREAAATARRSKARKRRRIGARTVAVVVLVGGAGALALNKRLRQKLLRLVGRSANESESAREDASATSEADATEEPAAPDDNAPPTASED